MLTNLAVKSVNHSYNFGQSDLSFLNYQRVQFDFKMLKVSLLIYFDKKFKIRDHAHNMLELSFDSHFVPTPFKTCKLSVIYLPIPTKTSSPSINGDISMSDSHHVFHLKFVQV